MTQTSRLLLVQLTTTPTPATDSSPTPTRLCTPSSSSSYDDDEDAVLKGGTERAGTFLEVTEESSLYGEVFNSTELPLGGSHTGQVISLELYLLLCKQYNVCFMRRKIK